MAVLAVIRLAGEPDSLLKAYDKHEAATRQLPRIGLVSHTAARTPNGLIMADVWESAELLGRFMAQPEFEAERVAAGLPEPSVEMYDVDRTEGLFAEPSATAESAGERTPISSQVE
jgi:hypothetical protein